MAAALLMTVGGGSGILSAATAPPRGQTKDEAYAVVAISVFREPGFALPGAEVTLTPEPVNTAEPAKKLKKLHGVTSPRGEYAFRVPPGPMRYTLTASAKDYKTEQKTVNVQGEERVDVTVTLESSSK